MTNNDNGLFIYTDDQFLDVLVRDLYEEDKGHMAERLEAIKSKRVNVDLDERGNHNIAISQKGTLKVHGFPIYHPAWGDRKPFGSDVWVEELGPKGGQRYILNLSPEEARKFAWSLLAAADRADVHLYYHAAYEGTDQPVWRTVAPCADEACITQGCPEHPHHHGGDHTYEQHHSPEDHVGDDPCRCTVYA